MAQDKFFQRLEAKLDALLEKAGIKPDDVVEPLASASAARPAHKLSKEEKQAIDNAPETPTATDMGLTEPVTAKARTDAVTNAPVTASSVPDATPNSPRGYGGRRGNRGNS